MEYSAIFSSLYYVQAFLSLHVHLIWGTIHTVQDVQSIGIRKFAKRRKFLSPLQMVTVAVFCPEDRGSTFFRSVVPVCERA